LDVKSEERDNEGRNDKGRNDGRNNYVRRKKAGSQSEFGF
jgi:hypothetical protein